MKASRNFSHVKRGFRDDIGIYVRSAMEANWARYLNFLIEEPSSPIVRWEYEPDLFSFPLKRGIRSYIPDFKVFEADGSFYYHEVKGYLDKPSQTKLSRMRIHHPKVRVDLIDSKIYRTVQKEFGTLIPGWEFPGKSADVY